ncbi:hypothetical protein TYRP_013741 [Tyrophagus putrescentiae]|nr:hypothetical protein TYRP_013741 [Tyrophagus putrescentiae]
MSKGRGFSRLFYLAICPAGAGEWRRQHEVTPSRQDALLPAPVKAAASHRALAAWRTTTWSASAEAHQDLMDLNFEDDQELIGRELRISSLDLATGSLGGLPQAHEPEANARGPSPE